MHPIAAARDCICLCSTAATEPATGVPFQRCGSKSSAGACSIDWGRYGYDIIGARVFTSLTATADQSLGHAWYRERSKYASSLSIVSEVHLWPLDAAVENGVSGGGASSVHDISNYSTTFFLFSTGLRKLHLHVLIVLVILYFFFARHVSCLSS
jgi:hypothetical protein